MKLGVVGNGMIVSWLFRDIQGLPQVEAAALCVRERSLEKGRALAAEHGVNALYTDYDAFLADGSFDTVYLGIVNCAHFSYAKKALLAGKHVICEKPFTVTGREARELAALARERGLFCWEAFKIPYGPIFQAVKEHLPDIGQIKLVQCNFSRMSSRYRQYEQGTVLPVFDPDQAGGCLYDINLYNLHFSTCLFGSPRAVHYFANRGYNGVDTSGTVILEYDGFHCVCMAAKDSTSPCFGLIQGTEGYIRVEGPVSSGPYAELVKQDGAAVQIAQDPSGGTLTAELREFARQQQEGDFEACYRMLDHSLMMAELVDAALGQEK